MPTAPFRLKFTNQWEGRWTDEHGSVFYFCNLGAMWPHYPTRRLIERTTRYMREAREFATIEEAREVLVAAGQPRGWEVVDSKGEAVE